MKEVQKVTVETFVKSHNIRPSLAAGFKEHMHKFGQSEYKSDMFVEQYEKFAGTKVCGKALREEVIHKRSKGNSEAGNTGDKKPDPDPKPDGLDTNSDSSVDSKSTNTSNSSGKKAGSGSRGNK